MDACETDFAMSNFIMSAWCTDIYPSEISASSCDQLCNDNLFWFHNMLVPGGGVHDLRMDGGLPPGFQKGTLF